MIEQSIHQLSHADAEMRYEAARTLGASRDERAVDPLLAAMTDENAKVQYACVSGLVKLAANRAANPIVDLLLADPDSRLWELLKLNVGMRLRAGILNMVERGDTNLADRLMAALENGALDEQQQAFIVRLVGRTGDERYVEPLIDVLIQDTPTMQTAAAEALGWIGDQRALSPLLLFMTDEENTLREVATEALGRLRDPRAVEPLLAALEDENEWVRRAAAEGLGLLGDKRAMEPLVKALEDEAVMVQDAAFDSIRQLSDDSYNIML